MEYLPYTASYYLYTIWNTNFYEYGQYILESCVSIMYIMYMRLTLINVIICGCKYVPMAYYMYRFIKDIYLTSRENVKRRKKEMEDIQIQIQMVNAKLCYCDAEFTKGAERLRCGAERLRNVRERVRAVISNDETLSKALQTVTHWDTDLITSKEQDCDFISELMDVLAEKDLKPNEKPPQDKEHSEHARTEPNTPEDSLYSSLSDVNVRKDCRVKIVRITNVYKVAYFKHYIKQKRLRRANRHALLKKKMENIKTLLENWQKTLTTVINSKLTTLNAHAMDVASQEAMGDYSKPWSYDSDNDPRHLWSESFYDDQRWTQNRYNPYECHYESGPDMDELNEFSESQEYNDHDHARSARSANMMSIMEETNSQIINDEENRSEKEDDPYYASYGSSVFCDEDDDGESE